MTRFRSLAAAAALFACALPALAAPPSADQVRRIRQVLGFDLAMHAMLDKEIAKAAEQRKWDAGGRACVRDEIVPVLSDALDIAFADLFESSENAQAWLDFADKPAGRTMMEYVRADVAASVRGEGEKPDASALASQMSEEDQIEMLTFMLSPAAQVLQKQFPELDLPAERRDALQAKIRSTCGVEFDVAGAFSS